LSELGAETQNGMGLIARFTAAARKLDEIRSRDLRATTLRSTLLGIASKLAVAINGEQQIDVTLATLQTAFAQQERRLTDRQNVRQEALSQAYVLKSIHVSRSETQASIKASQSRLDKLIEAKRRTDERIASAKKLGTKARDVRTAIVRRVFNDSLNAVWRDLFVRLAPEERFVPAFALPEATDRSVEAVLETIYRAGGKGGNPRAMLSAGNLNTAALTLFLALHLSVNEQLPWLVIDDPVQSMDEVHIAQFAALLRTLSKSHGRQIIVAMHERPLFEYLALELSPAFSDDRLITIELGQAADGKTTLRYEPLIWHPDTAIAA
jgi:exonuclease SbcC